MQLKLRAVYYLRSPNRYHDAKHAVKAAMTYQNLNILQPVKTPPFHFAHRLIRTDRNILPGHA